MAIFSLHVSQKRPRTGKAPLPGNISPPCIQNELALARSARHASEKPRKSPFGNAWRADLAREGPFSLHGPLESCIPRRSCHPSPPNSASARNPCVALAAPPQPQHSRHRPTLKAQIGRRRPATKPKPGEGSPGRQPLPIPTPSRRSAKPLECPTAPKLGPEADVARALATPALSASYGAEPQLGSRQC